MIAFKKQGHRVISLSQESGKDLHPLLQTYQIETYTHVLPGKKNFWYFFRQMVFFVRFCRKHQVEIVFSHLESANYVAAVGQYLIPARVILCRHHVDEASLYGFDKSLYYKLTYSLAKEIIVVSERARHYMIDNEKVPSSKIILINLAYDFSLYTQPDPVMVSEIRKKYRQAVLLLTVCRLTKYKRPDTSLRTIKLLHEKGIPASLVILGKGELKDILEAQVRALNLTEHVHLLGHVDNVPDFMQACDYLIHPSLLESSCVVIKEAGLAKKPVIVCEGVGDFDAYIQNGVNGFLVPMQNFEINAAQVIGDTHNHPATLSKVGQQLHDDVHRLFDVSRLIDQYADLIK